LILTNKSIKCADCGASFIFSTVEQSYFQAKGDATLPTCCPSCRQTRKERQSPDISASAAQAQRSSSRMFSTTCSRCGNRTEVPFEPKNHKAVYCSRCYDAIRGAR
jgi:CxxC-x17-CxxC domain-containing protein